MYIFGTLYTSCVYFENMHDFMHKHGEKYKGGFFGGKSEKAVFLYLYNKVLCIFTKKASEKTDLWLKLVIVFYALCEYNSICKLTRKKCINLGGKDYEKIHERPFGYNNGIRNDDFSGWLRRRFRS